MTGILRHQLERWRVKTVVLLIWWLIYFLEIGLATLWGMGFTANGLRLLAQALVLTALFIFFLRLITAYFWGFKFWKALIEL